MTIAEAKAVYVQNIASQSRDDILRVCRAGGIRAHKLKTNEQLAELLWDLFGCNAWQFKQAKEAICT